MCSRPVDRVASPKWVWMLAAIVIFVAVAHNVAYAQGYPTKLEFGTPATEQDIAAIAIAIPADGTGLPAGNGDYTKGKTVYEAQCAACHGADLMGVVGLPNMPAGPQLRLIAAPPPLPPTNPLMTPHSSCPS